MNIGAYQFAVTNNTKHNLDIIQSAVSQASKENVRLLIFPECALTGYPPRDLENAASADFDQLDLAYTRLQTLADRHDMYLLVGTITREDGACYNTALLFTPHQEKKAYHKRALWGWDQDNFTAGKENGIFTVDGFTIGVRICFEVRFPEFFRELYRARTDLNVILFYDVSDEENAGRYETIWGHIQTRAIENVTDTLSVNTCASWQTAPTAFYDKSGNCLTERKRNEEGLLVYALEKKELDFGQQGRKEISDWLAGMPAALADMSDVLTAAADEPADASDRQAGTVAGQTDATASPAPSPSGLPAGNYTYILRCADGSLYTGWTNDLQKRLQAHNAGTGSKYTRSRLPVTLAWYKLSETKQEAMSLEGHIKHLTREEKLALIGGDESIIENFITKPQR